MTKSRTRQEAEICEKCGVANTSKASWLRQRPAKLPPLLCPACAKTLSRDLSSFIKEWLKNKR